jgi:hypothetical protein
VEDKELLAAIGKVIVDSATLEYAVAVLVATFEGHRDQDREDRALVIVQDRRGGARGALRKLARQHPDRRDLKRVLSGADAVLEDRHVLAHSLMLEEVESGAALIFSPREQAETRITAGQVLDHAHDIRLAFDRVAQVIEAEQGAN